MFTRLLAASEDHVGTDMEECYGRTTEHINELLQRHEHEANYSADRTNFPRRLNKFLRDFGANDDKAYAISNAKVQEGASAATKAVAAAQRSDDNAKLSRNSDGGSAPS
jgi:hypothetical protein